MDFQTLAFIFQIFLLVLSEILSWIFIFFFSVVCSAYRWMDKIAPEALDRFRFYYLTDENPLTIWFLNGLVFHPRSWRIQRDSNVHRYLQTCTYQLTLSGFSETSNLSVICVEFVEVYTSMMVANVFALMQPQVRRINISADSRRSYDRRGTFIWLLCEGKGEPSKTVYELWNSCSPTFIPL